MNLSERTFDIEHADSASPLVISVPHAGTSIPAEDAPTLALGGDALLRDADLFVDQLYGWAPEMGVTVMRARVNRCVLDVNRAPDDVDLDVCPEVERPARPSARGLCWRTLTDGSAVLSRTLRWSEVRSRIERIHAPYHRALAALLHERRQQFGYAILLDAHSMPSLARLGHLDALGSRRADIVPGDVRGTSCDPRVMQHVVEHFEAAEFSVRPNEPYAGGYITRHHGRPRHNVHAVQLELNRDLYMDERMLTLDGDRASRLVPHLQALVTSLRDLKLAPV